MKLFISTPSLKPALKILAVGMAFFFLSSSAQAQTIAFGEEKVPVWGPTFSIAVVQTETGLRLDVTGHPALNPESRRIDTLDVTAKFQEKDTEKYTLEGVAELKEGQIELEGEYKELRFSYKTRRPGTVTQGRNRVSCSVKAKKAQLPAILVFESYKEGPRCKVTDSSS